MSAISPAVEIDRDFAPAQPRLYYGWINLMMAAVAMTATLPGRTHGLGLISKPLTEDPVLNVNEALFSHLNFWAILVGSAICLPVGRLIDRFGVRIVLTAVALALGLSVAAMSQATNWLTLLITLTLVRGFGQGSLSVVSLAMVGKWFTDRLGLAMGVFTVLLTIGFIVTVVGTGMAVVPLGWRGIWLVIAGCLVFGLAPLGWLFVRSSPESMGVSTDLSARENGETRISLSDLSLRSALSSPAFWIFAFGSALYNLSWSAVTLFQESLLTENGFEHNASVMVMGIMTFTGLPSNLLAGWLAKPARLGWLMGLGMLVLAGALLSFPWLHTQTDLLLYGTALGVSGGIITVIFFSAFGQAFGRTNLGAIQAVAQVISVLASAAGPILLTTSRSGESMLFFFRATAAVAIAIAVVAAFTKLPSRKGSPVAELGDGGKL